MGCCGLCGEVWWSHFSVANSVRAVFARGIPSVLGESGCGAL